VESELWPNLIVETHARGVPMALVNARLSERSFRGWNRARGLARRLLSCFDVCLAQDEGVASRLTALGASSVQIAGSLKADAPVLPVDESALAEFLGALGTRPLFLAASTHPGEEEIILDVTEMLRKQGAHALTVIVPRHPARGKAIAELAAARKLAVDRRRTTTICSHRRHRFMWPIRSASSDYSIVQHGSRSSAVVWCRMGGKTPWNQPGWALESSRGRTRKTSPTFFAPCLTRRVPASSRQNLSYSRWC